MGRPDRPLDPDAGPLGDFAADLRALRRQAGNPTYRTLAQQTHYSATTLSDAAGGRKLPTLPVLLAYIRACGGDIEVWRVRWQEVADALKSTADSATLDSTANNASQDAAADVATLDAEASAAALQQGEPAPGQIPATPTDERPSETHVPQPTAVVRGRRTLLARLIAVPLAIATVIAVAVIVDHGGRGALSPSGPGAQLAKPPRHTGAIASAAPTPTGSATPGPSDPTVTNSATPVATAPGSAPPHAGGKATGSPMTAAAAAAGFTWSAFSGPKCASSGAAALSFYSNRDASAPWHTTAVSGPSGYNCADPQYTHLSGDATSSRNDADWVFEPSGTVSACRFRIYVPQGIWADSVIYKVYPVDASNGYNGQAIASFTVDQASAEGGGWITSPQISVSAPTIDLQITDQGAVTRPGAVADVVQATCS